MFPWDSMRHMRQCQLPFKMTLKEDFGYLFDNRDLNGNEPDEPDTFQ